MGKREDMQKVADNLKQADDVQDARIVEFLGKPHIHIDFKNDDIGVIGEDGEARRIPVKSNKKG